jgi:hypothetical protein
LIEILKKLDTPMTPSALAKQALGAGYHTASKSFVNVVSAALSNMDNVEKVKDQGYRLKRSK